MKLIRKKSNQHGYAMVLAVLGLLILSLASASYLKKAFQGKEQVEAKSEADYLRIEMNAMAYRIQTDFTEALEPILVKPSDTANANDTAAFATFMNTFRTNEVTKLSAGFVIDKLECQYEEENYMISVQGVNSSQTRTFPLCTKSKGRMPKTFLLVLSKKDPTKNSYVRLRREFQIKPGQLTDYSLIILSAPTDIKLGKANFESPVALFFQYPQWSRLIFTSPEGTTISKFMTTNLADERRILHLDTATSVLPEIQFNRSAEDFQQEIRLAIGQLRQSDDTYGNVNQAPGGGSRNNMFTVRSQIQAGCAAAYGGLHNCSTPLLKSTLVESRIENGACKVRLTANIEYTAAGQDPPDKFETYEIYDGVQTDDNVYNTWGMFTQIRGENDSAFLLCARQSFIGANLEFYSPVIKSQNAGAANSAFFSTYGAMLVAGDGMKKGTVLYTGANGYQTLSQLGGSIVDDVESFTLQASLITGTSALGWNGSQPGTLSIPKAFYESTNTLGTLKFEGLVVVKELPATSKRIAGQRTGFANVKMGQSPDMLEAPPPGVDFEIGTALKNYTIGQTLSTVDLNELILQVSQ